MASIKKIYEDAERTTQIFPKTHTKAVVDDDGVNVDTKIEQLTDLVNQKQMDVGAVPSDLTPTKGSTNWVTSDGIYESQFSSHIDIASSDWLTSSKRCVVGSDGTYKEYNTWAKSKFIPVIGGTVIRVTASANGLALLTFVTSSSVTIGSVVPLATGETVSGHRIAANTTADLVVPSDAVYIHSPQKTSDGVAFPSSVEFLVDSTTAMNIVRTEMKNADALKQNIFYERDISGGDIVLGRDDIDNGADISYCATLRWFPCLAGDVISFRHSSIYPNIAQSYCLAVFDRNMNTVYTGKWISSAHTIEVDGFYSAVISTADPSVPATSDMLLESIVHETNIANVANYCFEEHLDFYPQKLTYKNLLLNNTRNVLQYTGASPKTNQLRFNYIAKLYNCQSIAIYNGYLFDFNKGGSFKVYEFGTFRLIGEAAAIYPTTQVEFNASWFSNEFYDQEDQFPILYTESIYSSPACIGLRIQHVNGVWSITQVQEIYRDGETGGAGVTFDQQNDRLIYWINNVLITYPRPKYSESVNGVSTLYETDVISTVNVSSSALDIAQDKSVYGNIAVGISYGRSPSNRLIGLNLTTGEMTFSLAPFNREGEGVEWYNGILYVCDIAGYLYEVLF